MKLLDIPSSAAVRQAKQLLQQLGLIFGHQLTSEGQLAQRLGVEPRIAAMLIGAQQRDETLFASALAVAVMLEEPERNISNVCHSLHRWQQSKHSKTALLTQRANALANKLNGTFSLKRVTESACAIAASLAFPDRIAQKRGQQFGRYLMANGHGAELREDDPLGGEEYLVVLDLMRGQKNASQIQLAIPLDLSALQQSNPSCLVSHEHIDWDETKGRLLAEKQRRIGELVVNRETLAQPGKEKMTQALLSYVRRKGLAVLDWGDKSQSLLERIRCAIEWLPEQAWPAMDDASLLSELEQWLEPYMAHVATVKDLAKINLCEALNARLGWPLNQQLDEWLPKHYTLPTGTQQMIRYQQGANPVLSVRMQEMFGEQSSPTLAQGRVKLTLELLSPARRPLQVTQDLAGFWAGAYKEVQKEMKGRYPKHVWPDDPATHQATNKTKRQLHS